MAVNQKTKISLECFLEHFVVLAYALYGGRSVWLAFDKMEYLPWLTKVSWIIPRLSVLVGLLYIVLQPRVSKKEAQIIWLPVLFYMMNILHTYNGYSGGKELVFISTLVFVLMPANIKARTFNVFYWIVQITNAVSLMMWIAFNSGIRFCFQQLPFYSHESAAHTYWRWFIFAIYDYKGAVRLCSIFNEPGALGTICALLFICTFKKSKIWEKSLLLITGICTFSLAFFLMIFIYAVIQICFKRKENLMLLLIFAVVFALLPYVDFKNEKINKFTSRLSITEKGLAGDNRVSSEFDEKYSLYLRSADVFFGLGEGYSLNDDSASSYKSYYVVPFGIIGTAVLLGSWFVISYRNAEDRNQKIYCLIFFLSLYQRPAPIEGILGYILVFGEIEWYKTNYMRKGKINERYSNCKEDMF